MPLFGDKKMKVSRTNYLRYRKRSRMRYSGSEYESWLTEQKGKFLTGGVTENVLDTLLRQGATPAMIESTIPILFAFEPEDIIISGAPKVGEMLHGELAPYLNGWPPLSSFTTLNWAITDNGGAVIGNPSGENVKQIDMEIVAEAVGKQLKMRTQMTQQWQGTISLDSAQATAAVEA